MTTNTCGCDRPCRLGFTLCTTDSPSRPSCRSELERHLAEMRWLDEELTISLTGSKGIDYRTMGGAKSDTLPLPWNERASRARHDLKAELVGWVRIILPRADWPSDRLTAIAACLMMRLDLIAKRDDAWTIYDGITLASQKARAVVFAKPADRRFLIPCEGAISDEGEVISESPCDGEVWALDGASVGECDECRRAYDVDQALTTRDVYLSDKLFTAQEIAHLTHRTFGVPVPKVYSLVTQWSRRGRITPHGTAPSGAPTFPYREVSAMLVDVYGAS